MKITTLDARIAHREWELSQPPDRHTPEQWEAYRVELAELIATRDRIRERNRARAAATRKRKNATTRQDIKLRTVQRRIDDKLKVLAYYQQQQERTQRELAELRTLEQEIRG